MKALFLMGLLLMFSNEGIAQFFCGRIEYKFTYRNARSNEDVTDKVDDIKTETFVICGNNFKVYFDGVLSDIYIGDSATYVHLYSDSTGTCVPWNSEKGKFKDSYTPLMENVEYKGKMYSSLEEGEGRKKTTFYVNDQVRIDPSLFKTLSLFHWNKFFEATGGRLGLIRVNQKGNNITVSEAVEIETMPLTPDDFVVPAGCKLTKYNFQRSK